MNKNKNLRKKLVKNTACTLASIAMVATPCMSMMQPMTVMAAVTSDSVITTDNIMDYDEETYTSSSKITVHRQTTIKTPVEGAKFAIFNVAGLYQRDYETGFWNISQIYDDDFRAVFESAGVTFDEAYCSNGVISEELAQSNLYDLTRVALEKINNAGDALNGDEWYEYCDGLETTDSDGNAVFGDLKPGYYLIMEVSAPSGNVKTSPFLMAMPSSSNYTNPDGTVATEWVYSVEATPKAASVGTDKYIVNAAGNYDSGIEADGYKSASDTVAIGDKVKYMVRFDIPEYDETLFESDNVVIDVTDYMSEGLSIITDKTGDYALKAKIYTGNPDTEEDVSASYYNVGYHTTVENIGTGTEADYSEDVPDLAVSFTEEGIKALQGKQLALYYYAEVNENVTLGLEGNTNDVYYTFTSGLGTKDTISPVSNENNPTAKVADTTVYSYGVTIENLHFDNVTAEKLAGAQFELYKYEKTEDEYGQPQFTLTEKVEDAKGNTTFTCDENGSFSVTGIDAGTYYLKMTKSPAGYTLLTAPVEITIGVEDVTETGVFTDGRFTLSVEDTEITATEGENVSKVDVENGMSTVVIESYKGFTLPETGGVGIIMTVVAAAAGLAVLTITMVRSKKKEQKAAH